MTIKSRLHSLIVGGTVLAVAGLTAAVVGKAAQTATVPNSAFYKYDLQAGQATAPISLVANQAVMVIGTQLTLGYRGVASATLLRVPSSFIEWVGLESTNGSAITQGFSGSSGVHILYLDYSHQVDLQVANPDQVMVVNGATAERTGNLTFIW